MLQNSLREHAPAVWKRWGAVWEPNVRIICLTPFLHAHACYMLQVVALPSLQGKRMKTYLYEKSQFYEGCNMWHKVEGDELFRICNMLVQFNSLSDYAESLKLITFVALLFRVIEHCKSAGSEKMDKIGLHAIIRYLGLKGLPQKDVHRDMEATIWSVAPPVLMPKCPWARHWTLSFPWQPFCQTVSDVW